jgi:AAA domain
MSAANESALRNELLALQVEEARERTKRARPELKPIPLLTLAEIFEQPDPVWLIEGWLVEDSLAVIAGPPDSGKSFAALAIACSVASDQDWFQHPTKHGQVLYIYSEGGSGIKKRIDAWLKSKAHEQADLEFIGIPASINMLDERAVAALIARIGKRDLKLIVLDTLARNFGGGNENATPDMNAFVQGCDTLRRSFSGCTLLVVHHTGWDPTHERGNSALRGAVDTMIKQERRASDKKITMTVVKQKDFEEDVRPFFLRLQDVPGSVSAALILSDPPIEEERGDENEEKVLAALATIAPEGLKPGALEDASGVPERTLRDVRKRLVKDKKIREVDGLIFVVPGAKVERKPVNARTVPLSPEHMAKIEKELAD